MSALIGVLALSAAACGGGGGGGDGGGGGGGQGAAPYETPSVSGPPPETGAARQPETREVTLEVLGKGKSAQPIAFVADTNGIDEDAELPWKKTVEIELTEAERQVGRVVSVIPGSVLDEKKMLKPGKCRIYVDGKKVADNDDRKSLCEFTLK
ncbi:hypothetical protein [Sinosporangium album]|nr:hypothetical protein [Sinosporangium album]